jgi:hypothetical protein
MSPALCTRKAGEEHRIVLDHAVTDSSFDHRRIGDRS